jgi:hypothetical protein
MPCPSLKWHRRRTGRSCSDLFLSGRLEMIEPGRAIAFVGAGLRPAPRSTSPRIAGLVRPRKRLQQSEIRQPVHHKLHRQSHQQQSHQPHQDAYPGLA